MTLISTVYMKEILRQWNSLRLLGMTALSNSSPNTQSYLVRQAQPYLLNNTALATTTSLIPSIKALYRVLRQQGAIYSTRMTTTRFPPNLLPTRMIA
jgi:hypothetical protein